MKHGNLFVESHLFNDQIGAFVGRETGVHPRAGWFGVALRLSKARGYRREEGKENKRGDPRFDAT